MVPSSAGAIVLIEFPFSDLTRSKLRPAVAVADAGHDDWVLCQITSKPYADPLAVLIEAADLDSGTLRQTSFCRPGKLFTAHTSLVNSEIGFLSGAAFNRVIDASVAIVRSGQR